MGYNSAEIRIPLRLDNLRMEIEALIASTPEYDRIATIGAMGP